MTLSDSDIVAEPSVIVYPAEQTPTETLYLSNIDLTVLFHVDTLYFFRPQPHHSSSETVCESLKKWLSQVLVPYHFLAGRLNEDENGRLQVVCNRTGVLFRGASSALTLEELGDVTQPNPSFKILVLSPQPSADPIDKPLLTVQVTRFRCGGFCIGMSTCHCLMDGIAACDFLENLSAVSKSQALSKPPAFDRSALRSRRPLRVTHAHPEYTSVSLPSTSTSSFLFLMNKERLHSGEGRGEICGSFRLSPAQVQALKKKAMCACSSFEAVVAHVWRARSIALAGSAPRMSAVAFAVDIRGRMRESTLPRNFAGNAVVTARASAATAELRSNGLGFAVVAIRRAVRSITEECVRSAIDWVESEREKRRGTMVVPNADVYVSAWWKLPLYDFDVGWGKPVYAGPLANGMSEFVLLLSPPRKQDKDAVHVWLTLDADVMHRFQLSFYDI